MYQRVRTVGVSERQIRRIIAGVARGRGARGAVSVHFIGDKRMRRLNWQFRGYDRTTDVLAFPTIEGEGVFLHQADMDIGDIFISVPQIRRQAGQLSRSYTEELARMLIHGMLHLLGYDHNTKAKETVMFGLQERLVNTYV